MVGLAAFVGRAETFHWTGSQDGFWTNATADWSADGRRLRFGCRPGFAIFIR